MVALHHLLPIGQENLTKQEDTMYTIYVLVNTINDKKYVGQTCDFAGRMRKHKCDTRDALITNAIRKHGWHNFNVIKLQENLSADEADNRERFWIDCLETRKPNGYNIESGGNRNKRHSKSTRDKISESLTGKMAGEKHPMYGKKHTLQTRQKMSDSQPATHALMTVEHRNNLAESKLGMPLTVFHIRVNLLLRGGWSFERIRKTFGHKRVTVKKYKEVQNAIQ